VPANGLSERTKTGSVTAGAGVGIGVGIEAGAVVEAGASVVGAGGAELSLLHPTKLITITRNRAIKKTFFTIEYPPIC